MKIAVSGINATDNPGPGVPVARSIKEFNPATKIIGLSYDAHDPGNYMNFVIDRSFRLPYPTKGWQAIKDQIERIRKAEEFNLMIPCLDVELPLYIKHQNELSNLGIKTFLPTENQFSLRAKDKLIDLAVEMKAKCPLTRPVYSIAELLETVQGNDFSFPVVIKGNYYKAYLVYNLQEATKKFVEIADEWGFPVLVQQTIAGMEVNLIGLGDGEGDLCGMVAIKKLMTTSLGKVWTGVTIDHPALKELAKRFVQATKWRGPFELECIQQNDDLYLIEINPRFPAWVYFATASGINLPARLVELMESGSCSKSSEYNVGKYLVRYTYEIVTNMEDFFRLASTT